MIDENEIIRKEEIDFRGIFNRIKRGWPVLAVALIFWLAIGVLVQLTLPPYYTAETSVLTEEPKGQQDPAVLVTGESVFGKPAPYYFNNQRIVFASYPYMEEAITRTGLIAYYKSGIINQEIYEASPFLVELDSTSMSFSRGETPYESSFFVNFKDFNSYHIEAEGKYLEGKQEFFFEGDFQFEEWVNFGNMKFKLVPQDTLRNPSITKESKLFEDEYIFRLLDLPTQIESRMKGVEVINVDIESTVFTASLSGFSAKRQQRFLGELGDVFVTRQMELKTQTLKSALDFLNSEIETTSSQLEESEDSLKYFKSENSITSIKAEGALLLNQTAKLQDQKIELVVRNKYYTYLEESLRENDDYSTLISPEAFGVEDVLLVGLTEELVELQQDLSALESRGAKSNPGYEQIKSSIASKRATILKSVEGFKSSNQIKLRDIENRIAEIDRNTKEFPEEESELLKLERRFRINEALYTSLMEKKSNVELSLVSMTSDFRIIEPSHLTTVDPKLPWAPMTFIIALLLATVTGFGILILIWIFRNGIDSSFDVRRHIPRANLLAEFYYSNIRKPGELEDYPNSPLANQVNGLIYNLNTRRPNAKSIAISSFKPSEGKTFSTAMMAVQYASSAHRVLIIDANVKDHSIGKLFRIPGGGQPLNSFAEGAIEEAIHKTSISNIDLLSLGKVVFNNAEVASFGELLQHLGSLYDRVLIDTAPVGKDTRSLAILNSSDLPIMVMRRKHTEVQDLLDVKELGDKGSIKELNCIVTGTFSPKTSFSAKQNPYEKNKKLSFAERIKVAFSKV